MKGNSTQDGNGTNQRVHSTRRKALKTLGGGIVGSTILTSNLSGMAAAKSSSSPTVDPGDEGTTWLEWDSASYAWNGWEDQYYEIDSGFNVLGAGENEYSGWDTQIHMYSYMCARRYDQGGDPNNGTPVDVIDGTWTGYHDVNDGSEAVLVSNDTKWIGGSPTPQLQPCEIAETTMENFADTVIGYASATVGYLKDAYETYQRMEADWNRHTETPSTSNEEEEWGWWYSDGWNGDQPSDAENWFRLVVNQSYNTSADVKTWGRFYDGGIWSNPELKVVYNATINSPDSASSTSTMESSSTMTSSSSGSTDHIIDNMSKKEKKEWGMKLVTPAALQGIGVDPDRYKKTADGLVWWATTPKVGVESYTEVIDDAEGDQSGDKKEK